jgi:hypothetical protein
MADGYYTKNINASKIGIAPIFTVAFRATRGGDSIKPLRRLLKYALRGCGLRAIDIRQSEASARKRRRTRLAAVGSKRLKQRKEERWVQITKITSISRNESRRDNR